VSRTEFEQAGLKWPLTVESGRIGCDGYARWFMSDDGTKYGLNGMAKESDGYAPIEPIWSVDQKMMDDLRAAGDDSGTVMRVNIGDMISEAAEFCAS
jgi:hypothetical protein